MRVGAAGQSCDWTGEDVPGGDTDLSLGPGTGSTSGSSEAQGRRLTSTDPS